MVLAKDVIRKFYVRLLQELPLSDASFVAMVKKANLFPKNSYARMQAKKTNDEKVNYFLRRVVLPGADVYLPQLLQVMEKSSHLNVSSLAKDIQQQLRGT